MQELIERKLYGEVLAVKIESMGATAVAIANRWQLGWPEKVKALLASGDYLPALITQTNIEKDVLAEATDLGHLAQHEIMALHEVPPFPPEPAMTRALETAAH